MRSPILLPDPRPHHLDQLLESGVRTRLHVRDHSHGLPPYARLGADGGTHGEHDGKIPTDLEVGLERTLAEWFAAWSETDAATRREALARCCADDIEFRDDWTVAVGIDALNQHIAMCFQFMPDWKLESTGEVRICREEALVGWRSVGPEGAMLEGFNHVSAARDGTLRRITGFQAG